MQENSSEVTLVVYDYDLSIAMRHTGGLDHAHDYEQPFTAILRARQQLKDHCQRLQDSGKVVLSIGTFGEYKPRIDAACEYLTSTDTPLLSHCEYVNKRDKSSKGKNKHIYEIIKSYYQQNPNGPRITKVYLLDDDWDNIFASGNYSTYITEILGITDARYLVKVKAYPVNKPALEKTTVFIDDKMVNCLYTEHDEELDTDVFVETKASQTIFLKTLESLEKTLLTKHVDKPLHNSANNLSFFKDLSSDDSSSDASSEVNPLTTSCGAEERLFYDDDEQKPDSLRSSSSNIFV